jgi:Uma2 family endonuclease
MMTTADYFATPETVRPAELAYGVLRVADAPAVRHQRVVRDLTIRLTNFTNEHGLGEVLPAPTDVVLDSELHLVVQPDVLFVSADRRRIVTDRVEGPPDLVVEVLSPHPRVGTLDEKVTWFARYGVRECWLVDLSRRQVVVLAFGDGRVVGRTAFDTDRPIQSGVLPGLSLRPADVFGWW